MIRSKVKDLKVQCECSADPEKANTVLLTMLCWLMAYFKRKPRCSSSIFATGKFGSGGWDSAPVCHNYIDEE